VFSLVGWSLKAPAPKIVPLEQQFDELDNKKTTKDINEWYAEWA
jgi:hypothetical protein